MTRWTQSNSWDCLRVYCPTCRVDAGFRCVTASKRHAASPHALRVDAYNAVKRYFADNNITEQNLNDHSSYQKIVRQQRATIEQLKLEIEKRDTDLAAAQEAAEQKLEIEGYVATLNPGDIRLDDEVIGVDNTLFPNARRVIGLRGLIDGNTGHLTAFRLEHETETEFWVYTDQHLNVKVRRFDAA